MMGSNGHALHSLNFVQPGTANPIPFHSKQLRIVLSNCGLIDPDSIDDYIALGGYARAGPGADQHVARGSDRRGHEVRAARDAAAAAFQPGSSGSSAAQVPAMAKVRHLQCRRRRPRRVHGPQHRGRQPPPGAGGHGHRRLCHRRAAGLRLHPGRVPAGDPTPQDRAGSRCAATACWARTSWDQASASTSRSASAPAPSSAAKRPR